MNESQSQSQQRRAKNEALFKQHNQRTERQLESVLPEDAKSTYSIRFVCECSNDACTDLIDLTLDQFNHYHKNPNQFILKPGHDQADIEKVVMKGEGFVIVEKLEIAPATDGKA